MSFSLVLSSFFRCLSPILFFVTLWESVCFVFLQFASAVLRLTFWLQCKVLFFILLFIFGCQSVTSYCLTWLKMRPKHLYYLKQSNLTRIPHSFSFYSITNRNSDASLRTFACLDCKKYTSFWQGWRALMFKYGDYCLKIVATRLTLRNNNSFLQHVYTKL